MTEPHRRRQLHFADRTAGWLPSCRTRPRRQLLVGLFGSVLLLALLAAALPVLGPPVTGDDLAAWTGLGYPFAILAALALWFVLRLVTSHVADLSRHVLDEREVALRQMSRSAGFVARLRLAFVVLAWSLPDEEALPEAAGARPARLPRQAARSPGSRRPRGHLPLDRRLGVATRRCTGSFDRGARSYRDTRWSPPSGWDDAQRCDIGT